MIIYEYIKYLSNLSNINEYFLAVPWNFPIEANTKQNLEFMTSYLTRLLHRSRYKCTIQWESEQCLRIVEIRLQTRKKKRRGIHESLATKCEPYSWGKNGCAGDKGGEGRVWLRLQHGFTTLSKSLCKCSEIKMCI